MTAATSRRPFITGFCGLSLPASSHGRCPRVLTRLTCTCTCHTQTTDGGVNAGESSAKDPQKAATVPAAGVPAPPSLRPGLLLPQSLVPGSAGWLQTMSASKVAAACGLSPYESPFSLWHRMAGLVPPQPDSDQLRRGHYLEPAIGAWFADQHPEWQVTATGTWRHHEHAEWTATPDGLVHKPGEPDAVLECKSAADTDEWGEPGTDQIPVGYRCQVLWQLHVLGLRTAHIAVLTAFLEFREYVVQYDADEVAALIERVTAFLASLPGGAQPSRPSLDSHSATYAAVRQLHPDIEPVDVDIDQDLAVEYCTARHALKAAEARAQHATSRVADALGSARRARYLDQTLATRQAKGDNPPHLVVGRNLPRFDTPKDSS